MDSYYASSTDLSSDSEPENVPQGATCRNRRQTKERFEGPGAGENGTSPGPEDLEDVPLDDSDSEPEIDDEESWHLVTPVDLNGANCQARLREEKPNLYAIPFFDAETEFVELEDGEENTEDHFEDRSKYEDRIILSRFEIPMSLHLPDHFIFEQQRLPMNSAPDPSQDIPGTQALRQTLSTAAHIAQNNLAGSYARLTGGLMYAARRTCDAVTATGQVGGHVVGGALDMGRDAAVRVQESWGNLPRALDRGILGTLTELVMEGVQSLPPSDSIIRPQGRRLY